MSSPAWLNLDRALADTGVFIHWWRGESKTLLSQPQHRNLLQQGDAQGIAVLAHLRFGSLHVKYLGVDAGLNLSALRGLD
jgi:hypothetical protein